MRSSIRVLTPPVSTLLTTAAAVQDELGNYDPLSAIRIRRLISQASGLITTYVERQFAQARYVETFWPGHQLLGFGRHCMGRIQLSMSPVASIVSVTSAGLVVDPATYSVDDRGRLTHFWSAGPTVVTYDAGYIVPEQATITVPSDLPADIERACIDTVVALWHRSGRGDPMIRSESVEGIGSTSYLDPASGSAAALPPTAVAALTSYQTINV